ncbi:MAG: transcriptional regulator [Spirochaetaceae bacterium]|nr:transcriptional regulator [Spirochaetaceae bacterium]
MSNETYVYLDLDGLFHAPARLSIATALYAHRRGMTFSQLKQSCELSDGNLSRHISRMEQESVVRSEKVFVERIPQTTITMTVRGRDRFEQYIESLRRIVDAQEMSTNTENNSLSNGFVYE